MFKKIVLVLLSAHLCTATPAATEKAPNKGVSVWKWVAGAAIGGGAIAAGIFYAPALLPAVAAVGQNIADRADAAKNAILTADPEKISEAAKYAQYAANASAIAVPVAKSIAQDASQKKLAAMEQAEIERSMKAKEEYENCLKKNKDTQQNVALGIPSACEEVAMAFLLHGGV